MKESVETRSYNLENDPRKPSALPRIGLWVYLLDHGYKGVVFRPVVRVFRRLV